MSANPNPDLESEVREIEKRIREVREVVIRELSGCLRDPGLCKVERVELEKPLKEIQDRE
jgi:hypothetical protein